MLTTGCNGCCFFLCNESKCSLNQLCVSNGNRTVAPGYCRQCRSIEWSKKQPVSGVQKLLNKVIEENVLKFDLFVFFDEQVHSHESLTATLDSDWYLKYARKVTIVDVTGFGERQNIALNYLQTQNHKIPTTVDSSVEKEPLDSTETTMRRLLKTVKSPFFMTINAGKVLFNTDKLASQIRMMPTRVISWSFPLMINGTAVIDKTLNNGLFLTKPYKNMVMISENKSFSEQLAIEEEESGMGLVWFMDDCGLV